MPGDAMNPQPSGACTTARLLRGGVVIDGTGAEPRAADGRIEQARISEGGPALRSHGVLGLGVQRRVLAPGFIDTHPRDDRLVCASALALPKIAQGATPAVLVNFGISLAPLVHGDIPPPLSLLGG